jgi:uncharacterized protein (DUF362 family)
MQMTGAGLLAAQTRNLISETAPLARPYNQHADTSQVALVQGEDRRKNIHDALMAIDDQIGPALARKKYVLIKPNCVAPKNQLACTHADTLRGVFDYLAPRFRGPIVIAEVSGSGMFEGYEALNYTGLPAEFRSQKVDLVDMTREEKYETVAILDYEMHMTPVRLAGRLFDPDAFVISCANLKTHSSVVATMTVKNMVMGAPLISAKGETPRWSDKMKYHAFPKDFVSRPELRGVRQHQYNIFVTAQKMQPTWGLGIIDGFEGMEGEGPGSGTPAGSRIAIASTDLIAADRVGVGAMGIDPSWVGYLVYSGQMGVGNYDMDKIQIRGVAVDKVSKKYQMPKEIEQELLWLQPPQFVPSKQSQG